MLPRASRSHSAKAAALLSALALTGCAGILPADHPLTSTKDVGTLATERTFAGSSKGTWPSDGWWTGYGDRQLDGLVAEGLDGASDIAAARARLERARAAVGVARSSLLPSVGATGKVDQERQSYEYLIAEQAVPHGWNDAGLVYVDASWEIDFWGKNRAALAAATSEAEAAEAEAAAARLLLSSAIASGYAEFAGLEAERAAVADAVEVRRRTLSLIEGRLSQSLENEGARDRARSAEAASRAELAEVDERIALSRNNVAALVGAGPDRGLRLSRPKVAGERFTALPAHLPIDLLGRRPDVVVARKRTEAAASRIDVAKAAFYPNVDLVGNFGRQSLGIHRLTDPGATFGSIGPAVSLPIFSGGRLVAEQNAAEATYAEAVATYDGTVVRALREVADAVASKRQLRRRLADTVEAENAAEKAWNVESERYRGGLATYLEVLSAEEALVSSRRAVAILRARGFALDIQMIRALGGGWRNPEKTS